MAPLTLFDIDILRANSKPLSTAVAAYASSDVFKSAGNRRKCEARSMDHRYSVECRSFYGSALKKSVNQTFKNSVISLGTGRPSAKFYPWTSIKFGASPLRQGLQCAGTENGTQAASLSSTINRCDGAYDITRGLNYGHAAGSPALIRFMTEHVEIIHNPPYENWSTCLSSGSTSALEVALRIFCNQADTILTERYTYPGFLDATSLHGAHTLGIEMDVEGLMPDDLDRTLRNWDEPRAPRPTVLYTIPSGQNPTGATQSLQRKQAICQVAEAWDLIIIEDDPYYFLNTDLNKPPTNHTSSDPSTYLASLPQSLLSLDTSGRVIRLDSFSKILAPGLRAGIITASSKIISKFLAYHEVSTVAVSGPSQLMLYDLLEVKWGHAGFFAWLDQLSAQYRSRLRIMLDACEKYLHKGICEWRPPMNGMFLWVSVDLLRHPMFRDEGRGVRSSDQIADIEGRILAKALENGVQVTMGSMFDANKIFETKLYVRMTYAAAEEGEIERGVERLAEVIRDEFEF